MYGVQRSLEGLVSQSSLLEARLEVAEASAVDALFLSLLEELFVQRRNLRSDLAFALLLVASHRLRNIDPAALENIEQDASLCALGVDESFGCVVLLDQQIYHPVVRREASFERALLFLFAEGCLPAHFFNRVDSSE